MTYQKIQLFPERPWVTLEYFGNDLRGDDRDAMLVIPGGGYGIICSDREGYPIAMAYYLQGMNTFVLSYSIKEQIKSPYQPLEEATAAMLYIRAHAEEFRIKPDRVFAVGFSAGGHLAAWLGTCWDHPAMNALFPCKGEKNRPTGVILCYAVITECGRQETCFHKLYGRNGLTREEIDAVSPHKFADESSSPAFIMHTFDDERVPIKNALLLADAYNEKKVPFEMHVYPHAPHGVALGTDVTSHNKPDWENEAIAGWVAASRVWMRSVK